MIQDKKSLLKTDDSLVIRFGLGVLITVFVIFGGWMAFAPLASSSVGTGKVSAGYEKKSIQHLEGGIIETIFVKDGDSVKKGDILIKLQDIQTKAQLDILESQYQDTLGLYNRLVSHKDNLKDIVFDSDLVDEFVKNEQRNLFYSTKNAINEEKSILENRILQLRNQIDGNTSLLSSKQQRLISINEEIKEWDELFKLKLVDKIKLRELQREANMLQGDVANTRAEIARLNEQIMETKGQLLLRDEEFKKETLNKLVETKTMLNDLKSKILAARDTLNRTEIIAPADGVVVGLSLYTIGGVIPSGQKILDIVPQGSVLIVEAQIPVTDIDKVSAGLECDIRFSAFHLQQTHVIHGKVIHVSADSFVDEATGNSYYEAKVEVTPEGQKQLKEYGFELVAGMPAEVMIKTGTRTTLSYLVKPFTDMLSRGFNEE